MTLYVKINGNTKSINELIYHHIVIKRKTQSREITPLVSYTEITENKSAKT